MQGPPDFKSSVLDHSASTDNKSIVHRMISTELLKLAIPPVIISYCICLP